MKTKKEQPNKKENKTAVSQTKDQLYWFLAVHNEAQRQECKKHWGWE